MSVGSLGLIGSIAGTPLAQAKGSDIDRAKADANQQSRAIDSVNRADAAAGIGVTHEDSQTSDRDADGRRIWEKFAANKDANDSTDSTLQAPHAAKDPTGQSGTQLDLSG